MLTASLHRLVLTSTLRRLALIAVLATSTTLPAQADTPCPRPPVAAGLQLPRLRAVLNAGKEGVIVALGSSSTEGVAASSAARTYPAILQAELARLLPNSHIAVVNRGIGGQDAAAEEARLDTDVMAVRPQLVIWQVGANGAMRGADPTTFRSEVSAGVVRLSRANIDVILMDNQRAPRILAAPGRAALERALADVAAAEAVNLFSRGNLMDWWNSQGAPPDLFLAADRLHHNDHGYGCMAKVLAAQIASAVSAPITVSASR